MNSFIPFLVHIYIIRNIKDMDKGKKVCDFCKNEITDLMSIHFGDFDYCSLDCALEDKDRKEVYNYLQKIDSRIVNYLEGQKKRKNDKLF